jgi:arginyl-tRNA synthetase
VKLNLTTINSSTIMQLLLDQLQAAINLYTETLCLAAEEVDRCAGLNPEGIPLYRVQDDMVYASAIALKLASIFHLQPLDIATQLVSCLPSPSQDTGTQGVLEFTVKVAPPGWIYFQFTDPGIAAWLQYLTQTPATIASHTVIYQASPIALSLFPVQYAHARCCSLLRLGHQQGLIKLSTHTKMPPLYQLIEPNPIPWLNADKQLQLVHPAELRLIAQLLGVLDELSEFNQPNWVKVASNLSDAMTSFYRHCRVWGEVKTQTPHLAQARLGLVGITQSVLGLMLQDILGATAPAEL